MWFYLNPFNPLCFNFAIPFMQIMWFKFLRNRCAQLHMYEDIIPVFDYLLKLLTASVIYLIVVSWIVCIVLTGCNVYHVLNLIPNTPYYVIVMCSSGLGLLRLLHITSYIFMLSHTPSLVNRELPNTQIKWWHTFWKYPITCRPVFCIAIDAIFVIELW